jgi:hypothetical protein
MAEPSESFPISPKNWFDWVASGRRRRAGQSMATIGTNDIEGWVAEFTARGMVAKATPPGQGPFRLARLSDPDGNMLTFAQDQRSA